MNDGRIEDIERRLREQYELTESLRQLVTQLSQQLPRAWSSGPAPSSGGSSNVYWAIGDGAAGVATGTWPSLSPYTFTSDIYKFVGTTQTLVGSSKTVNWPYLDAMSSTAGALIPCLPNADGSSYDAIEESCTEVA